MKDICNREMGIVRPLRGRMLWHCQPQVPVAPSALGHQGLLEFAPAGGCPMTKVRRNISEFFAPAGARGQIRPAYAPIPMGTGGVYTLPPGAKTACPLKEAK